MDRFTAQNKQSKLLHTCNIEWTTHIILYIYKVLWGFLKQFSC